MKIFISWSGERSKAIANKLRDWTQSVIQAVEPWMSAEDIAKGAQWGIKLADSLKNTHFGILCLTSENLKAPWLLFEAGALSKSVENARVCPFLFDLKPADYEGPFAQFQATEAKKKEDVLRMMRSMNEALENNEGKALSSERLTASFERCWPELDQFLTNIPHPQSSAPPKRSPEEILEEILGLVRDMARSATLVTGSGRGTRSVFPKLDYDPDSEAQRERVEKTVRELTQNTSAAATGIVPPPEYTKK